MKKITMALLIGAFLVILGSLVLSQFGPKKAVFSPFKGSKMAQELFLERKAIHDHCLLKIKEEFNIPEGSWQDLIETHFKGLVEADDLMGDSAQSANSHDSEIVGFAKQALVDYGVNPDKVAIRLVAQSGSPCRAVQEIVYGPNDKNTIAHRLDINEGWVTKYPQAMQQAFIRHEIIHLIHYDSLEGGHIIALLNQLGLQEADYAHKQSIVDYRHQRELRADILSLCDYSTAAKAAQDYFDEAMKKDPQQDDPQVWLTHPSDKKRHEQITQLLSKNATTMA
jgi:hypothetical protein